MRTFTRSMESKRQASLTCERNIKFQVQKCSELKLARRLYQFCESNFQLTIKNSENRSVVLVSFLC